MSNAIATPETVQAAIADLSASGERMTACSAELGILLTQDLPDR